MEEKTIHVIIQKRPKISALDLMLDDPRIIDDIFIAILMFLIAAAISLGIVSGLFYLLNLWLT